MADENGGQQEQLNLGGTGAPNPAGQGGGEAAPEWAAGLDPDLRGLVQTKGWKGPADALKSYVGLEKVIGADKVVLPPKGADGNPDWSKFDWGKLGRPESADKYAFKVPDGVTVSETDKAFQAHMAPILHAAGLAQWQVDKLTGAFSEFSGKLASGRDGKIDQEYSAAETALKAEWGLAFDQKLDTANRAIRQFGGPEVVKALNDSGLGRNPAMIKAWAKIGEAFAEDGNMPAGETAGGTVTPAEAEKQHAALLNEAAVAMKDGKSHPGWDKTHPEYAEWQAKKSRLAAMAWPEQKSAA